MQPGERLAECLYGSGLFGNLRSDDCLLGLTDRRLLFVPVRKNQPVEDVLAFHLSLLQEMRCDWGNGNLTVQFENEAILIKPLRNWRAHSQALERVGAAVIDAAQNDKPIGQILSSEQWLQQVDDLERLGMIGTAQALLRRADQKQPALAGDARLEKCSDRLRETRLALAVAAGFMTGMIAPFFLGLFLPGRFDMGIVGDVIFVVMALYRLIQGQERARIEVMAWVGVGAGVNLLFGWWGADSILNYALNSLRWLLFVAAMWLVMRKPSNRWQTLGSILIYLPGFIALMVA